MIFCKICHLPKPELQEMEKFESLKGYKGYWICSACRNSYDTISHAPEAIPCRRCIKCAKILHLNNNSFLCSACYVREKSSSNGNIKNLRISSGERKL
jgi:hypothetical protein